MKTLERVHEPISGVFPTLAAPSRERWALDADQVARFERDGLVAGLPLLDAGQVASLRERLAVIGSNLDAFAPHLYEVEAAWRERPDEVVLHFLGGWRVDEWLHDLLFHPGVTVPVAQLLGTRRLRFWHDQVFWKPARHKGVVPWHQDYAYWTRTTPANHLTLFITLDDMGPFNGGLEFVPGSHRWGLFSPVDFGGPMDQLREHLPDEHRAAFAPRPVELLAGQASLHHSHVVHGSRGNPSDTPRRALVLNFMGPETRSADGQTPLLEGVPTTPLGALVDGAFFPIVLDLDD